MTKWVSSGRVKTERAEYHIADLEKRRERFFDPAPYDLITENDPNTGGSILRFRRLPHAREIPLVWGAIAGDAIHNLRSALDVLWHQFMNPRPGKSRRQRKAYFPFSDSAKEFEARRSGVKEPPMKAAFNILSEFKPYKSGNENLWLLKEASVIDKHEVPAIVAIAPTLAQLGFVGTDWDAGGFGLDVRITPASDSWELVEDGKIFGRTLPGTRLDTDYENKVTFDIAFGECGILEGKAVLPTLHAFACITNAIAEDFLRKGLIQ